MREATASMITSRSTPRHRHNGTGFAISPPKTFRLPGSTGASYLTDEVLGSMLTSSFYNGQTYEEATDATCTRNGTQSELG